MGKRAKQTVVLITLHFGIVATKKYEQYWLKADRKWYTLEGALATGVKVGAGKGFWYNNRTNTVFKWVEARPYTF